MESKNPEYSSIKQFANYCLFQREYSFVVNKKANKVEIKQAVEKMYSVSVASVNTIIMPAKRKSRNTRSGVQKGHVPAFKKAIIRVAEGEEIDFFGDI